MYNWNYFDNVPQYHPIADANNLYDAFLKSRKGSHWKLQVQRYRWNVLSQIRKLQIELDNLQKGKKKKIYKLSPYSRFIVNQRGKIRAITALKIRDRIVKHVLNDIYLLPHISPYLIYDNGASLKNKGVSFTRNRLIAHLESFYNEYNTNTGYILTMDFSGYYDNIDHKKAKKMIRKYEKDNFVRFLVHQACDSYKIDVSYLSKKEYKEIKHKKFSTVEYRKENHSEKEMQGKKFLYKSLSVGDQTSQIIAISFPTPIDNLVKIVNGYKYYARYMDDFYIIARTSKELKQIKEQIIKKAKQLKIIINPKKTNISKLNHSFTFLQFKYYLTNNGHVVIRINPKTIVRMKRKLKKLVRLFNNKEVKEEKIKQLFQGWIGNYYKYMSNKQIQTLIKLYQSLYGDNLNEWLKNKHIIKNQEVK